MEYFVTGATGYVGGAVADGLLEDGHDVVALARTPADAAALAERGARVVEGDILEPATMREPMAGVDGVFHLAAQYDLGIDDPAAMERVNVEGTRTVLELVDDLDVPKAVYTSTLGTNSDTGGVAVDETYRYDGPHRSVYDRTKWQAHYEVAVPMAEAGVPVVTVLPGAVYGPGDASPIQVILEEYLTGDLPAVPRQTAFSFGHVEDIAAAHVAAMERGTPGEEYIIGGPNATWVEMLDLAEALTGIERPRAVSPRWFALAARILSALEPVVTPPEDYSPEALRVAAGTTYIGDNSKAVRELDIEHRPLREGLRETIAAERERLGV